MKIHLEKAIFVNRAPFERIELDFSENEIAVLAAVNGMGKTTIISHIADAFYEMARPFFPREFEGKENKLYRVSSSIHNLNQNQPSFVYLRFNTDEGNVDYVDIRENCTEEQYNKDIAIDNKVAFSEIKSNLDKYGYDRKIWPSLDDAKVKTLFNNIMTYFPSYRYEQPGYINDPYKIKMDFNYHPNFTGYLKNPIEVISELPQLANWIMDVILDNQYLNIKTADIQKTLEKLQIVGNININKNSLLPLINHIITLTIQENSTIQNNLSVILTNALISKNHGNLRFGIGPRNFGGIRVQIVENDNGTQIYPTIFNISSGEASMLCIFGELLRQADNIRNNIQLDQITGIVLIDEVDKHLHIKLQKEALPKLFGLFPNVQFIVSSHSPFLNMGLAEELGERSKIIDLDNLGISINPTTNELYIEVYNMMLGENERYRELYQSIQTKIEEGSKPLIITEGKTDVKHIKKAKEKLNIDECDIEFHEINEDWADSKLKTLLEQLSKVKRARKIIGIFDRDVPDILSNIEKNQQSYKKYGNNVYAFCIPKPSCREAYSNISIEFYYSDEELKKEKDGKKLYFNNEVEQLYNKRTKKNEIRLLPSPDPEGEKEKKIFCEDIGKENWIHSKARFAELVETDESFINDFDFTNFNLIFNKIKEINALELEV